MTTCVPLRTLKDSAGFADTVEASDEPIVVTRNGVESFVCMSTSLYDQLDLDKNYAKLMARMEVAEREHAEGKFISWDEYAKKVCETRGIQA